ncbi:hypothetical protein KC19_1G074700 [Ceratodon purpureus]|uniref:Uncharacterized protein n=1 Tax=Ceratodon purpureus TaxID=3225 RepID=A0A8T0J5R6_CERPU|nr:hypothetical protein KC19_1G074700 [Ceratodon purpureus]
MSLMVCGSAGLEYALMPVFLELQQLGHENLSSSRFLTRKPHSVSELLSCWRSLG